MTQPILRGNAAVAAVAENLGFLMPTGELPADTAIACARVVKVDWTGPDGTCGGVFVSLDRGLAEALTANLLGRMPGEPVSDEEIDGTVGELANVISGNLLPALYGTDHEFHLQSPYLLPPLDPGGRREAAVQFLEGQLVVAMETAPDNTRILRRAVDRT
jgi:CheY-specific phosphatase CheX